VLLAVMASMYAVYHGPDGLRRIAAEVTARRTCCDWLVDAGNEVARRLLRHDRRVVPGA
jgi:glycine dehydrogenase